MGNREFVEWLEGELEKRRWRPADLARAAGIYTSTLSKVLNEERQIGPDVALAIAKALKLPPETVFRRAGILPEYNFADYDINIDQLIDVVRRLDPERQRDILEYALWRYKQRFD